MTASHAPAPTAGFYLRRVVHLAAVINGTPADHALCGMSLQYGAIDTTADATCADCRRIADRLAAATPAVEPAPRVKLTAPQAAALRYYADGQVGDRMPHTNTLAVLRRLGLVEVTSERTANGRVRIVLTLQGQAANGSVDAAEALHLGYASVEDYRNAPGRAMTDEALDEVAARHGIEVPTVEQARDAVRISTREELIERQVASGATPERAAMIADARDRLQRELTAAAPAIAGVLDAPLTAAVPAPVLTASAVTRVLRTVPGGDLFSSRLEASIGVVRVSQRYAVAGALASVDLSTRREARARAGAEALRAAGYAVEQEFDRLTVTLPAVEPVHYTREQIADRFREVDEFVLVLGPDDRAYDPETGDTLLGGVTVRYARGEFPGPAYTATIERPDLPVDDDPREQPEPLEWSEVAGRPTPAGLDLLG